MSELESGRKTPSIELLQRYAEVFDIPASTLLLFAEKLDGEMHERQKSRVDKVLQFLEWVADDDEKTTD